MPNPRALRPNVPFLANYSLARGKRPTIADTVMPVLDVDYEIGVYNIFNRYENQTDDVVDVRASGAPTGEVDWSKTTTQYVAIERGLKHLVTDEEADVMGRTMADQLATDLVSDKLDLAKEKRVKALLTNTANFGTTKVASGAGGWVDAAADIIGDVRAMKRGVRAQSGYDASHIVIPDDVIPLIQKNTALITGGAVVPVFTATEQMSTDLPPKVFGLTPLTGLMVNNASNIGQTPALSQLWDGTHTVEVLYADPNPGILKPTWGVQFSVRTFGTRGVKMESWRDIFRKGDYIEKRVKRTEGVTFIAAGGIITGVN